MFCSKHFSTNFDETFKQQDFSASYGFTNNNSAAFVESDLIFTKNLFYHLFNEEQNIVELENQFIQILEKLEVNEGKSYWNNYQKAFAKIREKLDLDALAFVNTDPACKSLKEVYLAYPGFYAIAIYRLSHQLVQMNLDILARMMSEYAHSITGTDIATMSFINSSESIA